MRRWARLVSVAGALALWLLPGVALADNCSSLSDCYYTAQAAVAATTGLALLGILLSTTLDFIPFVGTAKGAYEAITGRDAVTGQELEWWERALGIVPFGGALLGAGAVGLKALDRSADMADAAGDIARGLDRAGDATRTADRTGEAAGTMRVADRAADAAPPVHRGPPQRPSWRDSELDVGQDLVNQGFRPQVSFKDGVEVPYGTKGSVRPEYYRPGGSVEVKNYDVATSKGRASLVRNVSQQAKTRLDNLPSGTRQSVTIDVRGQDVADEVLDSVAERITRKSGGALTADDITFKR